jgi:hypothetical protein
MSEPTYPQPPADRSVKVPHLVFGLLFLGVAGIWALGAIDAISGEHLAVLGPGVLILAGVIGLAATLANGRNRRRRAVEYRPESNDTATYDTANDTVADHGDTPTEEIR